MSKFLPANFDKTAPLLLIAGKGIYPIMTRNALLENGIPHKLAAFEGETSEELWNAFPDTDRVMMNVGQLGKLLKTAKNFGAKYAIMAGQITPRKLFKGLKPDLKAMMILATLKRKNAETIFGAIASELQKVGTEMIDARSFLDSSLAPKGVFCGKKPDSETMEYAVHAMDIVRECARLDIGQSCVASKGTILAVEAFEGTDKMIERAGTFEAKNAIFAKTVKPNQDYRFDVPVIGERTMRKLAESKIQNVILESEQTIILEKELVKKLAEENGISIYGL